MSKKDSLIGVMQVAYREVLRCLLEGIQWLVNPSEPLRVAGKSGISQARTRLGWEPLQQLHEQVVERVASPQTKGAWYRGWRLVTLDGSTLDLADERGNTRAFGRPGVSRGKAAYPQVRFVSLVGNRTHVLFGSRLDTYATGERRGFGRGSAGTVCGKLSSGQAVKSTAVDGEGGGAEQVLEGPAAGEVKAPAGGLAKASSDFEGLSARGFDLGRAPGLGQLPAEQVDQVVGEAVQQQAEGVGQEAVTAQAVGAETVLELLDAVLILAAIVVESEYLRGTTGAAKALALPANAGADPTGLHVASQAEGEAETTEELSCPVISWTLH